MIANCLPESKYVCEEEKLEKNPDHIEVNVEIIHGNPLSHRDLQPSVNCSSSGEHSYNENRFHLKKVCDYSTGDGNCSKSDKIDENVIEGKNIIFILIFQILYIFFLTY